MRTLGVIVGSIALLVVSIIVWWQIKYPTYSYRYRLTLAIEVDGKVHTGSSVIEIVWSGGPEFGDVGPYHPSIRGQAPVVDLGPRGTVVAALINGESYGAASDGALSALWIAARAFGNDSTNDQLSKLPKLTGRRDLAVDNMPRLIWFSNVADPKMALKLRADEIPKIVGANARLVNAFVEITRDPIVIDIDKKLVWFRPWADRYRELGPVWLPNQTVLSRNMFVGDAS